MDPHQLFTPDKKNPDSSPLSTPPTDTRSQSSEFSLEGGDLVNAGESFFAEADSFMDSMIFPNLDAPQPVPEVESEEEDELESSPPKEAALPPKKPLDPFLDALDSLGAYASDSETEDQVGGGRYIDPPVVHPPTRFRTNIVATEKASPQVGRVATRRDFAGGMAELGPSKGKTKGKGAKTAAAARARPQPPGPSPISVPPIELLLDSDIPPRKGRKKVKGAEAAPPPLQMPTSPPPPAEAMPPPPPQLPQPPPPPQLPQPPPPPQKRQPPLPAQKQPLLPPPMRQPSPPLQMKQPPPSPRKRQPVSRARTASPVPSPERVQQLPLRSHSASPSPSPCRPSAHFPISPSPLPRARQNTRPPIPPELYKGLAAFHAQGGFREAELPPPPPGWQKQHRFTPAPIVDAGDNGANVDINSAGSHGGDGEHDPDSNTVQVSNDKAAAMNVDIASDQDADHELDIEMDGGYGNSDSNDTDSQPAASRGGRPTSAQEGEVETCITQMLELVKTAAENTRLSPDRILKAFSRRISVEEALPRRNQNAWNLYQNYANHHEHYEEEARRVYAGFNKEAYPEDWRMESHELGVAYEAFKLAYGAQAQEILETHAKLNAPEETFGQRRRRWDKLVLKLENGVENIHQREDFEVMLLMVGPHVNADSGLAEMICTPGLKGFPETINFTEDDTIAAAKLTVYNHRMAQANIDGSASAAAVASASASTSRASAVASTSHTPPVASTSRTPAVASTSRTPIVASTSRTSASAVAVKRPKADYSNMSAQEKRDAQRQERFCAVAEADVGRDIFHNVRHNGFAWGSIMAILRSMNLRCIGWPAEARLPTECHSSKASNSWRKIDRVAFDEAIDARRTPGHGLRLQPQEYTPGAYVIYTHDYTQPVSSAEDFLYSEKPVPCVDGEGDSWNATYDLRHKQPGKATKTVSITQPNPGPVAKGKKKAKSKPKSKAQEKSAKGKGKARARSDDEELGEESAFDNNDNDNGDDGEGNPGNAPLEPRVTRARAAREALQEGGGGGSSSNTRIPPPPCVQGDADNIPPADNIPLTRSPRRGPPRIVDSESDVDMPPASAPQRSTSTGPHIIDSDGDDDDMPLASRRPSTSKGLGTRPRLEEAEDESPPAKRAKVAESSHWRMDYVEILSPRQRSQENGGNIVAERTIAPSSASPPDPLRNRRAPERPIAPVPAAPARSMVRAAPARSTARAAPARSAVPDAPSRPSAVLTAAPARPPAAAARPPAAAARPPAAAARRTANASASTSASSSNAAPLLTALVETLDDEQLEAIAAFLASRQQPQ
ncbi:hypothetical protein MSAN_00974200 [Mycena sanguinolenta]|uniref:Uncharacterized protein n=1 Tax=Mycena sanguinolenta TaxID=230812 RepID=A0A8H6Z0I7_9AGAR|nr:hypothetical protein MSAN_00974200 [Mycena sanguinolenta]